MPAVGSCPNAMAPFWFYLPMWLWYVLTLILYWIVEPAFCFVLPRFLCSIRPCQEIYTTLWHFLAALLQELLVPSFFEVWYHLGITHILGIQFLWHRTMICVHWLLVMQLATWWRLFSVYSDGHPGYPWWCIIDHQYKFRQTQGFPLAQTS